MVSTDEPGGLPALLQAEPGLESVKLRTVHRLDQVVGGVMVLAKTAHAARDLSQAIRDGRFTKEYLAVCHGAPPERGRMEDLLWRDRVSRTTLVVDRPQKDAKKAALDYRCLAKAGGLSLALVRLETGRPHQIRVQFASRGFPLTGDLKYGEADGLCMGLWSWHLAFPHPKTGTMMEFSAPPEPDTEPWRSFAAVL